MSNLYLVNTPDSVRTIQAGIDSTTKLIRSTLPPGFTPGPGVTTTYQKSEYISQSFDEYYYTLNKNNPVNHEISFIPYNPVSSLADSTTSTSLQSSVQISSTTRILTTEFSVPEVSNFAATSSNAKYGEINAGSNILLITPSATKIFSELVLDGLGRYTQYKLSNFNNLARRDIWSTDDPNSRVIANPNDRWFITLYNDLEFPITSSTLSPYNTGFSSSIDGVLNDPLASKGVFEVLGVKLPVHVTGSAELVMSQPFHEDKDIGNGELGFLMWKAVQDGKSVLVQNSINEIGAGAFTSRFTPEEITQNLPSITKEYGINKQ